MRIKKLGKKVLENVAQLLVSTLLHVPEEDVLVSISGNSMRVLLLEECNSRGEMDVVIKEKILEKFGMLGIENVDVFYVESEKSPFLPARILDAVQILAPCNAYRVCKYLADKHDLHYHEQQVEKELDRQRKMGFLVYVGEHQFSPTLTGIRAAAKYRRGRADINRILKLGRKL